ncbi:hypothetical protein, partial [uncultured Helicobacter sp.]|uniref:hypothetical protein n=1 Tax=uncultured Helicobacter sp. TaxID=175537 RepID=UPI0026F339F4
VVGRAGRGQKPGAAAIQTRTPEHDVIKLGAAQDYEGFYREEIALRELMRMSLSMVKKVCLQSKCSLTLKQILNMA